MQETSTDIPRIKKENVEDFRLSWVNKIEERLVFHSIICAIMLLAFTGYMFVKNYPLK